MSPIRDQSKGDTNLSARRAEWQAANLDAQIRTLLDDFTPGDGSGDGYPRAEFARSAVGVVSTRFAL